MQVGISGRSREAAQRSKNLMPDLTVILATFNGAETIAGTLRALTRLEAPAGGWKLVVVDNGSTDGTRGIVEKFADDLPLRLFDHPVPNKNAALNTAFGHVEGDLVIFTDDDIIPEPDWLSGFQRLASEQPSFAVFGGRIKPLWPSEPPPWIAQGIPPGPAFAAHSDDLEDGPTSPGMIWGGNMAIRRRVCSDGHQFNEAYGPRGNRYQLMGSETEFTRRVEKVGNACWFSNRIPVGHQILPVQFTPSWLATRARWFGATRAARAREPGDTYPSHALTGAVRQLGHDGARWVLSWLNGDRTARYRAMWDINYQLGYLWRRYPTTKVDS